MKKSCVYRLLALIRRNNTLVMFAIGACFGAILKELSFDPSENCSSAAVEDQLELAIKSDQHILVDQSVYKTGDLKRMDRVQTLIRPRYFETELSMKQKLLVAILPTSETLGSVAVALNKTLSQTVKKMIYFVDVMDQYKLNVTLPGIVTFIEKLHVLKPFHVLQYLINKFLNEYDYFFLMKDTTYLKGKKLQDMLSKISVSQPVYMGSPIKNKPMYCSLDGGVLLSHSLVKNMSDKLDRCFKNATTNDDDINLGQCIVHTTEEPCRQFVQGQWFENLHLGNTRNISELKDEKWKRIWEATTISPVYDTLSIYNLHRMFAQGDLDKNDEDIKCLQSEVTNISQAILRKNSIPWPIGSETLHKPSTRFDVIRWDYFNGTHIFFNSEFSNIELLHGVELKDILDVLQSSIKYIQDTNPGNLQFEKLVNGFRRFTPARGMDYILDILFYDAAVGHNIHKRLEASRPLSKVEIIPMPYVTENVCVNIVLPVTSSESEQSKHFIYQYAKSCIEQSEKVFLLLIFIHEKGLQQDSNFQELKDMVAVYNTNYKQDGPKFGWMSIRGIGANISELVLFDHVVKKFSNSTLVLVGRPTMSIREEFLNHVRMNTIKNWQVFSPIPFVEFHPDIVHTNEGHAGNFPVNGKSGLFDRYNYDHLSFYVEDYVNARQVMRLAEKQNNIKKNDKVDSYVIYKSIFNMFLKLQNLHIMRAVEPGLRLHYEDRNCDLELTDEDKCACKSHQISTFAIRSQIAKLIFDYNHQGKQV